MQWKILLFCDIRSGKTTCPKLLALSSNPFELSSRHVDSQEANCHYCIKIVSRIMSRIRSDLPYIKSCVYTKVLIYTCTHTCVYYINENTLSYVSMCDKCPNLEFFLVHIFRYSKRIGKKQQPEKPLNLDIFYAVFKERM